MPYWEAMEHKFDITSMQIISGSVFIKGGVNWLFQCSLFLKLIPDHCGSNHLPQKVDSSSDRVWQCIHKINVGVIRLFQNRFTLNLTPARCGFKHLEGQCHKIDIISMQIISGRVFINIHAGVIWIFQCGLFPETHTCSLWVQSLWGAMLYKSTLHQCRSYLVVCS